MRSDMFRLEGRSMALLCGLVLLVGLVHQSLMVSPWHRMVMATVAGDPPSGSMAMGADAPPATPSQGEQHMPAPASGECPAGQIALPQCVALPFTAPIAGMIVVAPPAALAASRPETSWSHLPPGRRRALLQIYII